MMYSRHPTIDKHLAKVRRHQAPYIAEIFGKTISIFPGVMSPLYDRSSQIFISLMPQQKHGHFLDMGTGCGIVAVFAAAQGADWVVGVDINEQAVANAQENFRMHAVPGTVLLSNLFEHVQGTFQTIFFNAPFHGTAPVDMLERGVADEEYRTMRNFFKDAGRYLAPDGRIVFGFSDMSDTNLLAQVLEEYGWRVEDLQKKENGDWTAHLYSIRRM